MGVICGIVKVWEGFRVGVTPGSCWSSEGFERCHGGDPRGDGGGETFCEEGTEGLVFPGLDVAGRPVVEKAYAEDVLGRVGDGDGGSERIGLTDVEG